MIFCERLKELREGSGLSQLRLSELAEISFRAYRYYEYGEREPTVSVLIKLADIFNCSLDYLVGRSEMSKRR